MNICHHDIILIFKLKSFWFRYLVMNNKKELMNKYQVIKLLHDSWYEYRRHVWGEGVWDGHVLPGKTFYQFNN